MLPAEYPLDLINCIIDHAAPDLNLRTLSSLSLVSKSFLSCTRHLVFHNLTVHVCGDPGGRCNTSHCLILLSQLLASPHCTIPRTVQRIVLSARGGADIVVHFENPPSTSVLFHGAGGMDDPAVMLPFLKHFRDVSQLELVDVDWFTLPSAKGSPRLATFFSSIQHLVIDGPYFYSGPEALFSIIHGASRLESLSILGASWPSRFTADAENASRASARLYPVYFQLRAMYKFKRRQSVTRYLLPKTLQHLTLNCGMENTVVSWVQQQLELGNYQLSRVELRPPRKRCETQGLQDLLNVLPTVTHLTVPWQRFEEVVPPVPSLSMHRGLRTLAFQLRAAHHLTWEDCVAWVRAALGTVTSKFLTTLVLDIVIPVDELVRACQLKNALDPVFERDFPGIGIQSLQTVDVRVSVVMDFCWAAPRHSWATWPDRCGPLLFPICDRKGLLHTHVQKQAVLV